MTTCHRCSDEITKEDFESEEEMLLCSPRGFLGEGWSNLCWIKGEEREPLVAYCLPCRKDLLLDGKDVRMVKIFVDPYVAQKWVKEVTHDSNFNIGKRECKSRNN